MARLYILQLISMCIYGVDVTNYIKPDWQRLICHVTRQEKRNSQRCCHSGKVHEVYPPVQNNLAYKSLHSVWFPSSFFFLIPPQLGFGRLCLRLHMSKPKCSYSSQIIYGDCIRELYLLQQIVWAVHSFGDIDIYWRNNSI